ncbi:MAG: polyamine aminopropyltransferase [Wenzhouxiangellaceae bacterium]|nr:polyamine aminopropyltransferase [Wenzhouxiangellaceae bacterium]
MLPDNENWFTEVCEDAGSLVGFRIDGRLAHTKTAFQTIDIYQTTDWGKLMVIDGFVMLTSRDNFLYHEMLTHPALFAHPDPKSVAIIGGGDCGTLHEVLAHRNVRSVVQCEIDEQVTRLSEIHFPELCKRNGDTRARLVFDDGLAWIGNAKSGSLDLIIVDSTDPIGPAEGLFGPAFVADCFRALADGGILVQQSESPLIHQQLIAGIRQNMTRAGFDTIKTLGFPQPCYPSGWWSCTQARKNGILAPPEAERFSASGIQTRYYNPEVHRGALATQMLG